MEKDFSITSDFLLEPFAFFCRPTEAVSQSLPKSGSFLDFS